mgnify:CR=1 FL=1
MKLAPSAHRVTTAHLQAVYPFVCEGGLGKNGVYIGQDLLGGAFIYDAFELYEQGVITSVNERWAFVRYGTDVGSRATDPSFTLARA